AAAGRGDVLQLRHHRRRHRVECRRVRALLQADPRDGLGPQDEERGVRLRRRRVRAVDARRHDVMSLPDLAIALALAWGAGLRAYAVIFAVGLAGAMGWVELPGHLEVLQHPVVLGASGFMTLVEFGADKLPWLDSIWDAVHSFIRIPAGAALAALAFGDSSNALVVAAGLLG